MSKANMMKSVNEAKIINRQLLREIKELWTLGDYDYADLRINSYFNSPEARLYSTYEANAGLKPHKKVKLSKVINVAGNINPWKGSSEQVDLSLKPKKR